MIREVHTGETRAPRLVSIASLLLAFLFAIGIVGSLASEDSQRDDTLEDPQCLFIGIEFGASYSRVGVYVNNTIYVVPNEHNEFATPNYVALTDGGWLVGEVTKTQVEGNEGRTFFDMRRFLGRQPSSPEYQAEMQEYPFARYQNDEGAFDIETFNPDTVRHKVKTYPLDVITAELLKSLKKIAETILSDRVDFAVLSIPAFFDDRQQQTLKDAANIAGLTVLRFVKEPIAAAMAYELDHPGENDTKSVAIIHAEQQFYVISSLGIESGIVEILNSTSHAFGAELGQETPEPDSWHSRVTQVMKSLLSKMKITEMFDFSDPGGFIISKSQPLALQWPFDEISGIGELKTLFPTNETFVRGVTVHAKRLWDDGHGSYQDDAHTILEHDCSLEVTPMSIGIRLSNGSFLTTIPSGFGIPTSKTYIFESLTLSQRFARLHIYRGERFLAERNKYLGNFFFGRMGRFTEKMRIQVTFTVSSKRHVIVRAEEIPPATAPQIYCPRERDLQYTREHSLASTWIVERMLAGKMRPPEVLRLRFAKGAAYIEEEREKMFAPEEVEMQWRKEDSCVLDRMRERGVIDEFGVELAELSKPKETS